MNRKEWFVSGKTLLLMAVFLIAGVPAAAQESVANITLTADSIAEKGGTSTVTAKLKGPASLRGYFSYGLTGSTATLGVDFVTGTLHGSVSSASVTFSAKDDKIFDPGETISVSFTYTATLFDVPVETFPAGNVIISIKDDESPPEISLSTASATLDEDDGSKSLTVRLSSKSTVPATVQFTTADGSAKSGTDYKQAAGTLTFAAGEREKTIEVSAKDDKVDEPNETFEVRLSNPSNASLGSPSKATITIADNDDPPTVSLSSSKTVDEGSGAVSLTVSLSGKSGKKAKVDYATANVTAASGSDYTSASGTLTFEAGQTSKTISIAIAEDSIDEPDETFTVSLSNPSNVTLGSSSKTTVTIEDNDKAPTPSLSLSSSTIEEGDSTEVKAHLSHPSSEPTTVTVSASGVTVAGGKLTIPAGEKDSSGSATLTSIDDNVRTGDRTVTVSGTARNSQGLKSQPSDVTLTIEDNDRISTRVTLSVSPSSIDEDGGSQTLRVTGKLNHSARASATDVSVLIAGTSKTLTIPAGESSGSVDISYTPQDNNKDELDWTVDVTGSTSVSSLSVSGTSFTVRDDDPPPKVSLSPSSVRVSEGSGSVHLKVRLDEASGYTVKVNYKTVDGSAKAGSDYTSASGTLTFSPDQTEKALSITLKDDSTVEPNETFEVRLSSPSRATLGSPSKTTVTITDDDDANVPEVSLSSASLSALEDVGSVDLTVRLDTAAAGAVTVDYATADGSAKSGADYVTASGTLTFAAGVTEKTLSVTLKDDSIDEPNEDFTVRLSSPSGATLGSIKSTVVTITDNDPRPEVSLSSAAVRVAEGSGSVHLKVRLDEASGYTVTVEYATADGSAKAGSDYTSASGTLTFSPDQTENTIEVSVTDDKVAESNETFEVELSSPSKATLGSTAITTVTITDDDNATVPEVSLSSASVSFSEGTGSVDLTVRLDMASSTAVTVDYATSDGSAKSGADYVSASGTLTFAAGVTKQTVSVTLKDDSIDEPSETFEVRLSSPSGATLGSIKSTVVTITDDDPPPKVSLSSSSVEVAESAGLVRLKVRLSEASGYTVKVNYKTVDGSAKAGSDYTSASGTLTFSSGQKEKTIEVSVTDDKLAESNETFKVELSSPSKATLGSTAITTVTIIDDDGANVPEVSLSSASASVSEGAGPVDLTVRLDTAATSAVTVDYATSDGSAKAGPDYTSASGTLTFAAGVTRKTVSVTLKDDSIDEPSEGFTLRLSRPSGATLGRRSAATVTIQDNDDAPDVSLVLTPSSISEEGGVSGVTAHLTHPSAEDTVVTVSSSPVAPAVAGDIEQSGARLTVAAGQKDSAGSVTVKALDNAVHAPDKRVTVSGAASNALGIAGDPDAVTLTIEEDDPAPAVTVRFAEARYTVREGGGAAWVRVTLSGPLASPVAVPLVATPEGGATAPGSAGADYLGIPERVTFAAESTSETFSIKAADDAIDDDGERVSLRFGALPGDLRLGDTSEAVVVLEDNDRRGLTLGPEQLRLEEGTSATYTVSLTSEPTSQVAVGVTGFSGTDLQVSPERLIFTESDWSQAQDITVKAGHDEDAFDDEILFTHTAAGGDYGVLDPVAFAVTVLDDDPRWVAALSVSPATVSERAGAASLEVTATLNEARGGDTEVNLFARPGPDTEAGDFAFAPATLVIAAGETSATASVKLTPSDDRIVEGAETVALVGAAEEVSVTEAEITITDDDTPFWAVTLLPASVAESAGVSTLTVESGGVTFEDSRTLALTFGGTADIGADYSVTSGGAPLTGPPYALVLPAGASSVEAQITALSDSMSDSGETVQITVRHDKTEIGPVSLTITEGICARTPAVRDALVSAAGASSCADVDADDLSAIASLDFSGGTVTSLTLKSGDLAGLSGLETLIFEGLALTSLPTDIFAGLAALERLNLKSTGLTALPNGVFSGLSRLGRLTLENNALGSLASNTFAGLTSLTDLNLRKTSLRALPAGVFAGLAKLTELNLRGNRITQLSSGIFRPLTALEQLNLIGNRLSALPDGLFEGLGSLQSVRLDGNSGSPFALALTLEKVGEDGVRMALPTGAPFDIVVAAAVSANGTLEGLNHGLTIATGKVHSNRLKVSRKAGEPGAVTATLAELPVLPSTHQGYALAKSADLPLTVLSGYVSAALSVADPPDVKEGANASVAFTVTLAPAVDREVTVTYATANGTAKAGLDYEAVSGTLTFKAGEASKTVTVKVLDDAVDETRETFRVVLLKALGADIADGDGEVAIVNADPLPKAWLARFGGLVAGHVADGIGERLTQSEGGHARFGAADAHFGGLAPFAGPSSPHAEVQQEPFFSPRAVQADTNAGPLTGSGHSPRSSLPDPDRFGFGARFGPHPFGAPQDRATPSLLAGRSFTAPVGGGEDGARSWTFWGRGMATRFTGHEEGIELNGEVTTYMAGADTALGRWRAGVALASSRGEGGYTAEVSDQGDLASGLISVHPYARVALSDRLTAWGLLGYGRGHLTLERGEESYTADTSMTMAGLGARGVLRPAPATGGFELALKADALVARMASDAVHNEAGRMAAAQGDALRLRLMVEGAHTFSLGSQSTLTPHIQAGVRHDGGDAHYAGGIELGGGVRYVHAGAGLSAEVRARTRITRGSSEERTWGASAALRLNPGASGKGLMLTITPAWGLADGAAEQLWAQPGGWTSAGHAHQHARRVQAEIGYALTGPKGRGLQTPYAGATLGELNQKTLMLGWRLAIGQHNHISVETTRSRHLNARAPDYGVLIRGAKRW